MRLKNELQKLLLFLAITSFLGLGFLPHPSWADSTQDQIDAVNKQIADLQQQIQQYQNTLTQLSSQKNTLQNAIDSLNISIKKVTANISITQAKITATNLTLTQLGGAITDKQTRVNGNKASIAKSLRTQNASESKTLVEQLLTANGFVDAWEEVSALATLNTALQSDIKSLLATKQSLTTDYNSTKQQQAQLVSLKKQLASQQTQLTQTKKQQTALLVQTKDSESNYQKLLAAAQAELASFSAFTQNAGGSGILSDQTSCDSWGCYYNQRDSLWGNVHLSGTTDRLAADGCLVTSMAMVLTHYGYSDVTPLTINSDPGNFSAVGGLLLATIHVDGVSATRIAGTINAILATGNPVIVGLHAYGGTHFVVIVSRSGSSYLMRDPYIANGKDISFTAHYALKNIYEVNKVIIGS